MAEQKTEMRIMGVTRYSNEQAKRITKECIETALIQLLESKEMDKISISEIVKRAGVSRTAFYAHYQSKEDILKSALGDVIDQIILLTPGNPRDEGYWLPLFTETKKYAHAFQLLLKAGLGDQILEEITARDLATVENSTYARYQEILWIGAVYNILVSWIKSGAAESPEDMAAICERIVRGQSFV